MTFNETMDDIAKGFEAAGVAVLVVGFVVGFVQAGIAYVRGSDRAATYRTLRSFVGRTILLSLEILVAADLIRTVAVDPSLENVASLAVIVLDPDHPQLLARRRDRGPPAVACRADEARDRLNPCEVASLRRVYRGQVTQRVGRGYEPVSSRRGLSTKIVSRSASVTPRSISFGAKSVTMYV